jgi:2-C-methyl-D-erythritol 4-phosphate cytidylyltransferase
MGIHSVSGHALLKMEECEEIDSIIITVEKEKMERMLHMVRALGCAKVRHILAGGSSFRTSVQKVVNFLPEDEAVFVIHEAVRPAVSPAVLAETARAAKRYGTAAAAWKIEDPVHQTRNGLKSAAALDQGACWAIQTPQAFRRTSLHKVLQHIRKNKLKTGSDLVTPARKCRLPVHLVESDFRNLKIRTAEDLPMLLTAMRTDQP